LGAMMAGLGLLFFASRLTAGAEINPMRPASRLIILGAVLLAVHLVVWLRHVSPTGSLDGAFVQAMANTRLGQVELLRVVLAFLTLWAAVLARHRKLTLALGAACLLVSGAVGHPAAIHPVWAVPGKMIHLLAGAIWLGGLLWILWVYSHDRASFGGEARRVSSAALISVIAVFLSGLLQTALFLERPSDLATSLYGRLVLVKVAGLLVLVGFGAYNRNRLLPNVAGPEAPDRLRRSVMQEIVLMGIVILVGGFLAYAPTPTEHASTAAAVGGAAQ
jgi:copper transport protein